MYKFYTIEGKKPISYKPTILHYGRAFYEKVEKDERQIVEDTKKAVAGEPVTDNIKQYLYLLMQMIADMDEKFWFCEESIKGGFTLIETVTQVLSLFTPREFMQMFPVRKEYNGEKYEIKDYFFTMDAAEKIGLDTRMGDNATEFLFDYCNNDVDRYMVTWMMIVNRMHQLNGGKDMLLEFMEDQGVAPHAIRREGNYFVDDETGERFEIEEPKNKLRELFTVVK